MKRCVGRTRDEDSYWWLGRRVVITVEQRAHVTAATVMTSNEQRETNNIKMKDEYSRPVMMKLDYLKLKKLLSKKKRRVADVVIVTDYRWA